MKERFLDLWSRIGAEGSGEREFEELYARYTESHRAYHNIWHIEDCLAEFDTAKHLASDPLALEMAIWYHDVIYETDGSADNEKESADLAYSTLVKAGVSEAFAEKVRYLIMATKHETIPEEGDAKLMADIDLATLGQPWEKFNRNRKNIREEYSRIPYENFAAGTRKIFEGFMNKQKRPSIYQTEFFRNKYEVAAETNMNRAMALLG
ncbi:TPA: N-methyl-D-aspartate receptor NMDAR2C subunit [Candidatus Woesearchaeota archaeon]|nr:hypothetical protein QT06_C0001G0436 [archaeon GW2011_AR15]MBS3103747.1 N-methyl-D-aspartate receptor NMDAR2C subunit [Candidatus Woesearchaeota archaeon]HIH41038.1 N-methyl-D-aspartate receptor NMDAR2C subunit [Candidatus Woesearchaeota archaeon]